LAATVGDQTALDIYTFLLQHTVNLTQNLPVEKWVFYSEEIGKNDMWDNAIYGKHLQVGSNLGERMLNAFQKGFEADFEQVIIIGSDMFHLSQKDLETAFDQLENHDYVLGPAEDGGYYLLGMKTLTPKLFKNKKWGTDSVLLDTLNDLKLENVALLPVRNDVDYYEDIKDIAAFAPFLKHIKQ
jgi:rSAM/selenodomain-associated transferase 1